MWPIRRLYTNDEDLQGVELLDDQDLVGFLCLDSTRSNAFSDYDVDLGAAIADALYSPLRAYLFYEWEYLPDDDVAAPDMIQTSPA